MTAGQAFAIGIAALVLATVIPVLLALHIAMRRRPDADTERAMTADLAEGATDIPVFKRAA